MPIIKTQSNSNRYYTLQNNDADFYSTLWETTAPTGYDLHIWAFSHEHMRNPAVHVQQHGALPVTDKLFVYPLSDLTYNTDWYSLLLLEDK